MKVQCFALCLVATLSAGGRAESAPGSEPPASPSTSPEVPAVAPPLPPRLEAQRQLLESRRSALQAQQRELEADVQQLEAEARRIDPEGRLGSDQLYQLLKLREVRRNSVDVDPATVVIPVFFFCSTLTGFLAWMLASYRRTRLLHETVRMMVEKGAEIPSGLLAPPPRKPSDLRRGIILSTSGLGLAIFLAVLPDVQGAWGAGLTLFFLGLGHLIVWRLQTGKGRLSSVLAPEPQP